MTQMLTFYRRLRRREPSLLWPYLWPLWICLATEDLWPADCHLGFTKQCSGQILSQGTGMWCSLVMQWNFQWYGRLISAKWVNSWQWTCHVIRTLLASPEGCQCTSITFTKAIRNAQASVPSAPVCGATSSLFLHTSSAGAATATQTHNIQEL